MRRGYHRGMRFALIALLPIFFACSTFSGTPSSSSTTNTDSDSGTALTPTSDGGNVVEGGVTTPADAGDAGPSGPCAVPNLYCDSFDSPSASFTDLTLLQGSDGSSSTAGGDGTLTVSRNQHAEVYFTNAYPYGSTLEVRMTLAGCQTPDEEMSLLAIYDQTTMSGVRLLLDTDGSLSATSLTNDTDVDSKPFGQAPTGWFDAKISFTSTAYDIAITPDGGPANTQSLNQATGVVTPSYAVGPSSESSLNDTCAVSFDWVRISQ